MVMRQLLPTWVPGGGFGFVLHLCGLGQDLELGGNDLVI